MQGTQDLCLCLTSKARRGGPKPIANLVTWMPCKRLPRDKLAGLVWLCRARVHVVMPPACQAPCFGPLLADADQSRPCHPAP